MNHSGDVQQSFESCPIAHFNARLQKDTRSWPRSPWTIVPTMKFGLVEFLQSRSGAEISTISLKSLPADLVLFIDERNSKGLIVPCK
jgi:hypothetical protein